MACTKDKSFDQLSEYKKSQKTNEQITTSAGQPVGDKNATQTVGPRGPLLMQDFVLIDEMAHMQRERIPERLVHAKGAGAYGYFEVTHDISKYCKAKIFERVGKKTPLFVRASNAMLEKATPDTLREPRGFAIKFYTEEGNWDMLCLSVPIFFIRDPLLFSSLIHVIKRNPKTNLIDPNMFWDFMTLRPEAIHHVTFHFADRGVPDGYRHMNAYPSHAFKMVNDQGEAVYCKFHIKTNQGIKNLYADEAKRIQGEDLDYASRDLYNAIEHGNYPSWTMFIQVMTFEEAERFRWNPFDLTKVWPHGEFPLIPVGRLVLNRNPKNFFAEVEQAAFSPSHLLPGIEPSPDKMLQARFFSYPDAHHHRVGVNYLQIPVNQPINTKVKNYIRDGPQCYGDNKGDAPNYYPNSYSGPTDNPKYLEHPYFVSGDVYRHPSDSKGVDELSQVKAFWTKVLDCDARKRLYQNIVDHLKFADDFIQKRAVRNFNAVDPEYGRGVQELLDQTKKQTASL